MGRTILLVLSAATLFAAENPWTKVKELKSGTDVLIVRKGVAKPIEAKFDEASDDAVVVVVKNEQRSIPKEEIDRLDYRPKGRTVTPETKHTISQPDPTPPVGMNHGANVPGNTYQSGITLSKPGYETIYRGRGLPGHTLFDSQPTPKPLKK
jgi:hypothetical protein